MSTNYLDTMALLERYRDRVREANQVRPVRQMQAGLGWRNRTYRRVVTRLGCRLVIWGRRMQAWSDAVAANPKLRTADRCR